MTHVYNDILKQREKQKINENKHENEPYNNQYINQIERENLTGGLTKKLSLEDEKVITNLIIAYYNSGVVFEFMNDKQEGRRFYKLAYDISTKELGSQSYLTSILSELN